MKFGQSAVRSIMLAPAAAATTERTASLNCQGADYAVIEIVVSATSTTSGATTGIVLKEADAATGSWVTFNSSFSTSVDSHAGSKLACLNVDLKGRKQFLQLTISPGTNTTDDKTLQAAVGYLRKEISGANSANADVVVVG